MIKKFAIGLVFLIALFFLFVAMQPPGFRVERSILIHSPAERIFDQVNNFHNWEAWSPWAKLDPTARNSFEGPVSGKGAVFGWVGNSDVGEGRMTIIESVPHSLIRIELEFIKPFQAKDLAEFILKPATDGMSLSWSMGGEKNFMSKLMCLFVDMDKIVGSQFETGLQRIKEISEKQGEETTPPPAKNQSI